MSVRMPIVFFAYFRAASFRRSLPGFIVPSAALVALLFSPADR